MAKIELKHVMKKYENGFVAVKDFNLQIEDREFIIFVGPSGCGKSTTLRMIAGLEEISGGDIFMDGVKINNVSPSARDIAIVFQNYALYPHMTVRKNIAYSLKIRREKKAVIKKKVQEAAEILGLQEVLDRKPSMLSGGQKQRVAMGRAIVRNPKVFLMDEPLSNLDAKLRGQMRVEIARLYHQLNSTFIYVTHDQTEAMTLGTRIVVMKDGIIQQVDSPQNLYHNPVNMFVAGFIGTPPMNFMEAYVTGKAGNVVLEINGYEILLPKEKTSVLIKNGYFGKKVIAGIRPDYVGIKDNDTEPIHGVGSVDVYEMLGNNAIVYISGTNMDKKIIANISSDLPVHTNDRIEITFATEHMHLFDKGTGDTIIN